MASDEFVPGQSSHETGAFSTPPGASDDRLNYPRSMEEIRTAFDTYCGKVQKHAEICARLWFYDRDAVEDVVQSALLEVLTKIQDYDWTLAAFRTWANRVVFYSVLNQHCRTANRIRRKGVAISIDLVGSEGLAGRTADEHALDSVDPNVIWKTKTEIWQALQECCNSRDLKILRLRAEGASRSEIADRLGTTDSVISVAKSRIVGKLHPRVVDLKDTEREILLSALREVLSMLDQIERSEDDGQNPPGG